MITHKELVDKLDYNPKTGIFTYREDTYGGPRGMKAGQEAGHTAQSGYRIIKLKGTAYRAHRLAWFYVYREWPKDVIDHINGNKVDNRLKNLRDVPHKLNARNKKKYSHNTSGHTGVYYDAKTKKWRSEITRLGENISLGNFKNKKDALIARQGAERALRYHKNNGRD